MNFCQSDSPKEKNRHASSNFVCGIMFIVDIYKLARYE
jgi:hypothetical protein